MNHSTILFVTLGLMITPLSFADEVLTQTVYHPNQSTANNKYVSENGVYDDSNSTKIKMKKSQSTSMNEYNRGVKQIVISGW